MIPLEKLPQKLRREYLLKLGEISAFRANGYELREKVKADPVRHGHLLTREMHKTELDCLKHLYPDLDKGTPKDRQEAWRKFLRTDVGQDFRASPYEKRYY